MEELRDPAEHERPKPESFLKVANFDTNLQACLDDPKKALSYQTGTNNRKPIGFIRLLKT